MKTNKVNTSEIIKETAKKMSCYQQDAQELISEHLFHVILRELEKGKEVNLFPFGKFYLQDGRKRKLIKFKPSTTFQEKIDNHFNM